jgi:hypothetical protein
LDTQRLGVLRRTRTGVDDTSTVGVPSGFTNDVEDGDSNPDTSTRCPYAAAATAPADSSSAADDASTTDRAAGGPSATAAVPVTATASHPAAHP